MKVIVIENNSNLSESCQFIMDSKYYRKSDFVVLPEQPIEMPAKKKQPMGNRAGQLDDTEKIDSFRLICSDLSEKQSDSPNDKSNSPEMPFDSGKPSGSETTEFYFNEHFVEKRDEQELWNLAKNLDNRDDGEHEETGRVREAKDPMSSWCLGEIEGQPGENKRENEEILAIKETSGVEGQSAEKGKGRLGEEADARRAQSESTIQEFEIIARKFSRADLDESAQSFTSSSNYQGKSQMECGASKEESGDNGSNGETKTWKKKRKKNKAKRKFEKKQCPSKREIEEMERMNREERDLIGCVHEDILREMDTEIKKYQERTQKKMKVAEMERVVEELRHLMSKRYEERHEEIESIRSRCASRIKGYLRGIKSEIRKLEKSRRKQRKSELKLFKKKMERKFKEKRERQKEEFESKTKEKLKIIKKIKKDVKRAVKLKIKKQKHTNSMDPEKGLKKSKRNNDKQKKKKEQKKELQKKRKTKNLCSKIGREKSILSKHPFHKDEKIEEKSNQILDSKNKKFMEKLKVNEMIDKFDLEKDSENLDFTNVKYQKFNKYVFNIEKANSETKEDLNYVEELNKMRLKCELRKKEFKKRWKVVFINSSNMQNLDPIKVDFVILATQNLKFDDFVEFIEKNKHAFFS